MKAYLSSNQLKKRQIALYKTDVTFICGDVSQTFQLFFTDLDSPRYNTPLFNSVSVLLRFWDVLVTKNRILLEKIWRNYTKSART